MAGGIYQSLGKGLHLDLLGILAICIFVPFGLFAAGLQYRGYGDRAKLATIVTAISVFGFGTVVGFDFLYYIVELPDNVGVVLALFDIFFLSNGQILVGPAFFVSAALPVLVVPALARLVYTWDLDGRPYLVITALFYVAFAVVSMILSDTFSLGLLMVFIGFNIVLTGIVVLVESPAPGAARGSESTGTGARPGEVSASATTGPGRTEQGSRGTAAARDAKPPVETSRSVPADTAPTAADASPAPTTGTNNTIETDSTATRPQTTASEMTDRVPDEANPGDNRTDDTNALPTDERDQLTALVDEIEADEAGPERIDPLVELLDSDSSVVKREAALALGTLGSRYPEATDEAIDALNERRLDPDIDVSNAASEAVREVKNSR